MKFYADRNVDQSKPFPTLLIFFCIKSFMSECANDSYIEKSDLEAPNGVGREEGGSLSSSGVAQYSYGPEQKNLNCNASFENIKDFAVFLVSVT